MMREILLVSLVLCFTFVGVLADCSNPQPLELPSRFVGNTANEAPIGDKCPEVAQASQAAWFSINGTGQTIFATTCNNETLIQTRIVLFSALSETINCTNLRCNVSARTYQNESCSVMTWFAEANTTYFLAVIGSASDISGQFTLSVDLAAPPTCAENARSLPTLDYIEVTGDTSSSGVLVRPTPPTLPSTAQGLWYRFVGDGRNLTLSTCNSGTNFNTAIAVFRQSGCITCHCAVYDVTNNDAVLGSQGCSTLNLVNTVPGTTYLLFVGGPDSSDVGIFNLTIRRVTAAPAPIQPPMRPPVRPPVINYDGFSCATAIPLTLNQRIANTLTQTTGASGLRCGSDTGALARPGKWFSFTAPSNGTFTMHSCGSTTSTDFDHELYLYTQSPGASTSVCSNPSSALSCFYTDDSTNGLCAARVIEATAPGQIFYGYLAARSPIALSNCDNPPSYCDFLMTVSSGVIYAYAPIAAPFSLNLCSASSSEISSSDTPVNGEFTSTSMTTLADAYGTQSLYCGLSNSTRGVLYRFRISSSRSHEITTCFSETTVQTQLIVFYGSSCSYQYCASVTSSSCTGGLKGVQLTVSSSLSSGDDLFIFVSRDSSDDGPTGGSFRLRVTAGNSATGSNSGLALGLGLGLPMGLFFILFIVLFICMARRAQRSGMLSAIASNRNGLFGSRFLGGGSTYPTDNSAVVVAYSTSPAPQAVQMTTYSPS